MFLLRKCRHCGSREVTFNDHFRGDVQTRSVACAECFEPGPERKTMLGALLAWNSLGDNPVVEHRVTRRSFR